MSPKPSKMPQMNAARYADLKAPDDPVAAVTASRAAAPTAPVAEPKPVKSKPVVQARAPQAKAPSRANRKQLGVWVHEQTHTKLKYAALDLKRSIDEIVNDLIDDFLSKHEKRKPTET
jgi:hypothetical protein